MSQLEEKGFMPNPLYLVNELGAVDKYQGESVIPTIVGYSFRKYDQYDQYDHALAPRPASDPIRLSYIPSNGLEQPVAPKVAVLLCTCHGQDYLAEQLDSIAAQTYPHWQVCASDDGSADGTHAILENYQSQWGADRLSVSSGPVEGFATNFLTLTCKISIQADYYAYADQDDVWEADKLRRATDWLKTIPVDVPALYCSRTQLVDAVGSHLGYSPLFKKPPSFGNALVQNVGGGNTMVFNNAARLLLCEAGVNVDVVTHDWWAYIVVSGCGGKVFYDTTSSLRYRQHGGNLVGANNSWSARMHRVRMLLQGRFRDWSDSNIQALFRLRPRLTPENQLTLDRFAAARNRWLLPRVIGIKRSGVYRQTVLGNMGLVVAALLKKI